MLQQLKDKQLAQLVLFLRINQVKTELISATGSAIE